jgi:hypothetical protein
VIIEGPSPRGDVEVFATRTVLIGAFDGPGAINIETGEVVGQASGLVLLDQSLVRATDFLQLDLPSLVRVRAGDVVLRIFAAADGGGSVPNTIAGGVDIVANSLELSSQSELLSSGASNGGAGAIRITVRERLLIGYQSTISTDGPAPIFVPRAGPIILTADTIEIRDGGSIDAEARGTDRAGSIKIEARRISLTAGAFVSTSNLDGLGGAIYIVTDSLLISGDSTIDSSTIGSGDAGDITVRARTISLNNGSFPNFNGIVTDSFDDVGTIATGNAGNISVAADVIEIGNHSQISSSTNFAGNGGSVYVQADRIIISGNDLMSVTGIFSDTGPSSSGNGGNLMVSARYIDIKNGGRISTTAFGSGNAGRISIDTRGLSLLNNGGITSSVFGAGRAGDISLQTDHVLVDHGVIRTAAVATEGGRIAITADDLITLRGAEITSSGAQPVAGASLITLRAPLIILLDGSRVTSLTGDGIPLTGSGEVRLEGDLTFISEDSQVLGSSTVELAGVDNTVGTGLQVSPGAFLDAGALLGQTCAARRTGKASTFARWSASRLTGQVAGWVRHSGRGTPGARASAARSAGGWRCSRRPRPARGPARSRRRAGR